MKRWKVAISLAILAALVGPLVAGTWKLKPGQWRPLLADEHQRITRMAAETTNCTHFSRPETEIGKAICTIMLSDMHAGGRYESGDRITWRYAERNLAVMAASFIFVLIAAMVLPTIGARYLAWLKR